jgi:AcrR family transcriptional regulator
VGVGQTTVADIARRAGVQRLTVYNHFADLNELLPACSAHYLSLHPLPDLGRALALDDPYEHVRRVLVDLYRWYRDNEGMQLHVQGERATVPELEVWMAKTSDATFAELAKALAAAFRPRGRRGERLRAQLALALDFWTWRRLSREGLNDEAAAELMTAAAVATA